MTKVFLAVFSLFMILLILAVCLASTSLKGADVDAAKAGYEYYQYLLWRRGPLSALALWSLANILAFQVKGLWPIWLAFLYWCVAVFLYVWWLSDQYTVFYVDRLDGFYDAPIPLGPTMFLFFTVPALAIISINHVVVRLALGRDRPQTT